MNAAFMAPALGSHRLRRSLSTLGVAAAVGLGSGSAMALDASGTAASMPAGAVAPTAAPPGANHVAAVPRATAASGALASRSRPSLTEAGVAWKELTPAQKEALQPLQRDWPAIEAPQKRKWIALATRMPAMSTSERTRIQTRMTDWAKLTPEQRGEARLRYQEARQVPAQDRQARWEAYQSLPPEQRHQLAERAARAASAARRSNAPASGAEHGLRDGMQAKSNLVTRSGPTAQRHQVGPTLAQARPGATTTLISRPAAPPLHQQTGLPKIAATPEFVDKATLLPRRGPQATATAPSVGPSVGAPAAGPATATGSAVPAPAPAPAASW